MRIKAIKIAEINKEIKNQAEFDQGYKGLQAIEEFYESKLDEGV